MDSSEFFTCVSNINMGKGNVWSIFGLIILSFAAVLIVLAFATPYWLETDAGTKSFTHFEKLGLWEACFDGYSDRGDQFGRTYTGCRWMFSREYDMIRTRLMPGWFVTTQALMTMNVVFATLGALFGLLVLLGCFPENFKKWVVFFLSLTCYGIALMMVIALIFFGSHGDSDKSWLKLPRKRHLSWSFYCAVIGGIISILAGMCYTVNFIYIRKSGHRATAHAVYEMRHYRSKRSHY